jgi:hypothetical protein
MQIFKEYQIPDTNRKYYFIASFFISFLLILIFIEIFFWLFDSYYNKNYNISGRKERFVTSNFLPFEAKANDDRILEWNHEFYGDIKFIYKNNKYGFLGDDFNFKKDSNEIRIVTLGGSTTWAMGIDSVTKIGYIKDTWPMILENKLKKKYHDKKITVYNLAQDMYASPMSLINLSFFGLSLIPDIVISNDNINDIYFTFDSDIFPNYLPVINKYPGYKSVSQDIPQILLKSRSFNFLCFYIDRILGYDRTYNPYLYFNFKVSSNMSSKSLKNIDLFFKNIKTMKSICDGYNITFIATTAHYFEPDSITIRFNNQYRDFLNEHNIYYFDADKYIPKYDKSINTDKVHFTTKGTDIMANGYFDFLVNKNIIK